MQKRLISALQIAACLMLMLAGSVQAEDKKADPTGTWTWSTTGQDGTARTSTLKLKLDGDKLTGTMSGRQNETPIEEATIKGDEIAFKVTREFNGNKFTSKYSGKIAGDTIKGKSESERNGETRTREWEAKREAKKS